MIGAIILIAILYGLSQPILQSLKKKHKFLSLNLMNNLFWYHFLFIIIYYTYVQFNRSDSYAYFNRTSLKYVTWFDAYGTGTTFIDFFAFPFVRYFHFSYEMMMVFFGWLGFLGFVYFYIFFKENIKYDHKIQGFSLLTILMFLPNMHFWTASFGKGSLLFFGLGLVAYAISRFQTRKILLVLGMILIYFIRPHIFLFIGIAIVGGFFTGNAKLPLYQKLLVVAGSIGALIILYEDILVFAKIDPDNMVESFSQFSTHRSGELAKAGSGVDISNYSLPMKLFTFWYRPLFIDSPTPLGIIISLENVFYLVLTAKLFQKGFFNFLRKTAPIVRISLIVFFLTSVALSTVVSNLGLIIRQKSMVMYFFFFVILAFMDYKRFIKEARKKKLIEQRQMATLQTVS